MTDGGIVGEYRELAREADADLLAMQVGDFYEFFGEDAETVAREIDLTLTEKGSAGETHSMAGVPVSELTPHVTQLVERGYRVAVADQHETDDGGHARSLTRVVTPGTSLDAGDAAARYLVAVVSGDGAPDGAGDGAGASDGPYGLAFADVTTGAFHVTTVPDRDAALSECHRFDPVEVLPGPAVREGSLADTVAERADATLTEHDPDAFAPGAATHAVRDQFGESALDSVDLEAGAPPVRAAGAVLAYVGETGAGVRASLTRLGTYSPDDGVALDATTRRNLELTEPMHGEGDETLLDTVDHTVTAAGRRLLGEWLTRPRQDRAELERRLDGVAALTDAALARESLRETLGDTRDLARLASRAASGSAGPRDLAAIRDALSVLPELREAVERAPALADSPVAQVLDRPDREAAADLRAELADALVDEPPASAGDGGLFRRGYDEELDAVVERHESLRTYFEELAERERARLGVTHLQVDRNRTDGYYVQIGKSEADAAPPEYREVKTLKNSKRFTTEELEEREREILQVEERREALERAAFDDLRERVGERTALLQAVGRAFAEVDVLAALATHAVTNDWVRPTLRDPDVDLIDVEGGRHPVVEQTVEFVPNDARLGGLGATGADGHAAGDGTTVGDGGVEATGGRGAEAGAAAADEDAAAARGAGPDGRRFVVVTGPNMSGKSTYMRQVALIVLLAQAGSFVPASRAELGLVDGIYTRVGALDELASGRSTFMVEMQELSKILHAATERSLVVLDEVGRGTATYDGISIAWAATEYLHNEVRALTLFATHYHELTTLADHLPRVANVHVAAAEEDGDVTFLRTVEPGATDRSYGIHVADLAGVPEPVVDRATDVLDRLREEKAVEARGGRSGDGGGTRGDGATPGETVQAVFDVGSGDYRERAGPSAGDATSDPGDAARDPAADDVLAELRETPIAELSPVELMARVEEWQSRLAE
ncbi:MAG: DNA mismatch repair protein MutS [Halobacteriaceae archaeon]